MNKDMFGNLREWGIVLEQLEDLKQSRKLDEHQKGLARILRYRDNWCLREKVLEYANEIENPTDELLSGLFYIITGDDIYLEARVLAVNTLGYLILKRKGSSRGGKEFDETKAVLYMIDILDSERPPHLRATVAKALGEMGDKRALPTLQKMSQSPNSSPFLKKCVDEAISRMS